MICIISLVPYCAFFYFPSSSCHLTLSFIQGSVFSILGLSFSRWSRYPPGCFPFSLGISSAQFMASGNKEVFLFLRLYVVRNLILAQSLLHPLYNLFLPFRGPHMSQQRARVAVSQLPRPGSHISWGGEAHSRLCVDSVSRIPTGHNWSLIRTKASTCGWRKACNLFSELFIESSSAFHKLSGEFSAAGANKLSVPYMKTSKRSNCIFQSLEPRLAFFPGGTDANHLIRVVPQVTSYSLLSSLKSRVEFVRDQPVHRYKMELTSMETIQKGQPRHQTGIRKPSFDTFIHLLATMEKVLTSELQLLA